MKDQPTQCVVRCINIFFEIISVYSLSVSGDDGDLRRRVKHVHDGIQLVQLAHGVAAVEGHQRLVVVHLERHRTGLSVEAGRHHTAIQHLGAVALGTATAIEIEG